MRYFWFPTFRLAAWYLFSVFTEFRNDIAVAMIDREHHDAVVCNDFREHSREAQVDAPRGDSRRKYVSSMRDHISVRVLDDDEICCEYVQSLEQPNRDFRALLLASVLTIHVRRDVSILLQFIFEHG